jgi:Domain of unknown function DUF11
MKKFINDLKNNLSKTILLSAILVIATFALSSNVFAQDGGSGGSDGGGCCGGGGGDSGYGGGGYSDGGGYNSNGAASDYYWSTPVYTPVYVPPTCSNGYTNYPTCGPTTCTNGATNFPSCNNNVCTNGTTNFPNCNVCPSGKVFINNTCTNVSGVTAHITANPSTVTVGNPSTLTWTSSGATYCVLTGGGLNMTVGVSGNQVVYPNVNTNYNITCYNAYGNLATSQTIVNVNAIVNQCNNGYTNYPTCGPTSCTNGATNFPSCNNNVCTNGTTNFPHCNVCPSGQTFINNTCTTVNNTPTATIYPSSYSINSGSNVTLNWSSTNASYCTAQPFPFSGSKGTSGSESVYLTQTTTFTITCFNSNGQSAQAQTTVSVNQQNPDVFCNGVRYPAGSICPNVNNSINVSTTGSNPLTNSANIFGYVNPNNGNAQMWFEYGTSYSLGNRTNNQTAYSAGSYSAQITGLSCGTTYYYRAVAQNNFETKYGSILSFVTSACQNNNVTDSTVLTRSATLVYQNGAQLNGAFVYGTNSNNCSASFEYGTNYSLGNRTASQSLYNNSGVNYYSSAVSGLTPNTRYYYRAVSNCNGVVKYGAILSFVTSGYVKHTTKTVYKPRPITKVVTAPTLCNCDTNNVSSEGVAIANVQYMDLLVERMESSAMIGGNAGYRAVYKNTSSTTLQDVVIRVILPEELSIVSADRGDYTVGGQTLTYAISQLSKLEEGRLSITTKVKSNATAGNQIVVNAYANYSVPAIVKNGQLFKDEVTAYVLSVLTDGSSTVNSGNNTNNNTSMFGSNFWQWIVLLGLVLLFIISIVYLFTASKRRQTN